MRLNVEHSWSDVPLSVNNHHTILSQYGEDFKSAVVERRVCVHV